MPSLLIKTNVATLNGALQNAIMKECSVSISELIGKPESFVLVSLETCKMIFGGTPDPCAFVVSIAELLPYRHVYVSVLSISIRLKHIC